MVKQLRNIPLLLCCIVVFSCKGLCAKQDVEISMKTLRMESERVRAIYEGKGSDTWEAKKDAILKADTEMAVAIKQLFVSLESPELIKERTKGVVNWREWPISVSRDTRWKFLLDEGRHDKTLRVNYRHRKIDDDINLYLLQHSFFCKKGRARVSPTMYTVMVSNGRATMSMLPAPMFSTPNLKGTSSPEYLLGFVERGSQLPDILVIDGPSGSGSHSRYYLYSHNNKRNRWEYKYILHTQGTSEFAFDEEKQILRYKRVRVIEGEDIEQSVDFVICNDQMPLKLKISTVPGATYSKDEAPLEVMFQNSGEEAIGIGTENSDDYLGQFEVDVRRSDGTAVLNVPKVRVQPVLSGEPFELKENESHTVQIDVAKLFNVNKLEKGIYEIRLEYRNSNPDGSHYFSGILQSNIISLNIKTGRLN